MIKYVYRGKTKIADCYMVKNSKEITDTEKSLNIDISTLPYPSKYSLLLQGLKQARRDVYGTGLSVVVDFNSFIVEDGITAEDLKDILNYIFYDSVVIALYVERKV